RPDAAGLLGRAAEQRMLGVLAIEVRDDRERFGEHGVTVADHRHLAARVEREERGRLQIALGELEQLRLVRNALELGSEQHAPRERTPGTPVDFEHARTIRPDQPPESYPIGRFRSARYDPCMKNTLAGWKLLMVALVA